MASTSRYRAEHIELLLGRLDENRKSDDEICSMLRTRLSDLSSGNDTGLTFKEVFGEEV